VTRDSDATLSAIDSLLERGGDADDVLRDVVLLLHERSGYPWVGILFAENDRLVLGPEAGEQAPELRTHVPVSYRGTRVAELAVDGAASDDRPFFERVALLVSELCLVGWDTGGEDWRP
jgi:hypothetical protein